MCFARSIQMTAPPSLVSTMANALTRSTLSIASVLKVTASELLAHLNHWTISQLLRFLYMTGQLALFMCIGFYWRLLVEDRGEGTRRLDRKRNAYIGAETK